MDMREKPLGAPDASREVPVAAHEVAAEVQENAGTDQKGTDSAVKAEGPAQPTVLKRQALRLSDTVCDLRVGPGAIDELSHELKVLCGRCSKCFFIFDETLDEAWKREIERQLTDAGFTITAYRFDQDALAASGNAYTCLADISQAAAAAQITRDDLLLCAGGAATLSLANYLAASWCGRMRSCMIATSVRALIDGALEAHGLPVAANPHGCKFQPVAKLVLLDSGLAPLGEAENLEAVLMHSCLMALASDEDTTDELKQDAPALLDHDLDLCVQWLVKALRLDARIQASSQPAQARAIYLGRWFAESLQAQLPDASLAQCLAEALRFSTRLSYALEKLDLDSVMEIDGLLDVLAFPTLCAQLDADRLADDLSRLIFSQRNKCMLELPEVIGRVRPNRVPTELLREHIQAFCLSRQPA